MPTVPSPQTVLDRVRRDVERNALRARNGIKLVAGVDRPGVGQTPEGRRLAARPLPAVALPQRPRDARRVRYSPPLLIVFSLISRSYILDLTPGNSFVEQLLDGRVRRVPARLGRARRAGRANRLEDYVDDYIPAGDRPGAASSPAPTRSTCSATASAATWRCSTPRTTPTRRCAA